MIRDGVMEKGVILRHLVLPGHVENSLGVLDWIGETFAPGDILVSLMSQYTPMPGMPAPLDRPVTSAEYGELVDYAIKKGITNAFIQDASSAAESFIPPFDSTGV